VNWINAQEVAIPGLLPRLTVIRLEGTTVETLDQFTLRDPTEAGARDQRDAAAPQGRACPGAGAVRPARQKEDRPAEHRSPTLSSGHVPP